MVRSSTKSCLAMCILLGFLTNAIYGAVLSSIIGQPLSHLAGAFVGADKLKGNYALAGLLLSTPVLKGRYSGTNLLGITKGGTLKDTLNSKLDALFDPLLAVEPFKYNPLGKKGKKPGLFDQKLGTALTTGGDVISSKLQPKLDALSSGLGVKKQAPFLVANAVDTAIRTKENIVRGAIDGTESILETNPQTAAMKNLLFRALIYHIYMDAGLNARLSMLEQISKRVLSYKKFFKPLGIGIFDLATPVLDRIRGATGTVATVLALPARVFNLQAEDEEPDDSASAFVLFSDRITQLQDAMQLTQDSATSGQTTFFSSLDNWLETFRTSQGASRIDQAQRWRLGASDYLDRQTITLERDLNSTLNARSDALIGLLDRSSAPEVDIAGARTYLSELARVTGSSTGSALDNYLELTGTVFDSIRELAASGVSNPLDYQRAGDLLGAGAANTATSIWDTYQSAFNRQQQIADLFNLDIPAGTDAFNGAFSRLLNTLQDFSSIFPVPV